MSSATPARCGSRQKRFHDACSALFRLITAISPLVAGASSITVSAASVRSVRSAMLHYLWGLTRRSLRSAEALLEAFETHLEQRGVNQFDDGVRLAVRQIQ